MGGWAFWNWFGGSAGAYATGTAAAANPRSHDIANGILEGMSGIDGPGSAIGADDAFRSGDEMIEAGSKLFKNGASSINVIRKSVASVSQAQLDRIRRIAPDAIVGYRGSLVKGDKRRGRVGGVVAKVRKIGFLASE